MAPLVQTIIETGRPRDQAHTCTFYISTFPSYFQEFFLYSLTAAVTQKSEVTEPQKSAHRILRFEIRLLDYYEVVCIPSSNFIKAGAEYEIG